MIFYFDNALLRNKSFQTQTQMEEVESNDVSECSPKKANFTLDTFDKFVPSG